MLAEHPEPGREWTDNEALQIFEAERGGALVEGVLLALLDIVVEQVLVLHNIILDIDRADLALHLAVADAFEHKLRNVIASLLLVLHQMLHHHLLLLILVLLLFDLDERGIGFENILLVLTWFLKDNFKIVIILKLNISFILRAALRRLIQRMVQLRDLDLVGLKELENLIDLHQVISLLVHLCEVLLVGSAVKN